MRQPGLRDTRTRSRRPRRRAAVSRETSRFVRARPSADGARPLRPTCFRRAGSGHRRSFGGRARRATPCRHARSSDRPPCRCPASCTRNPTGAVAVPPGRHDAAGGAHADATPTAERRPHVLAGQSVVSAVLARWARTVTVLSSGPRHGDRARRVQCVQRPRGAGAPSRRVAPRGREELRCRSPGPTIPCAVAGRHPVASSRASIPSRRGESASCRSGAGRRPAVLCRARHDSGGVTSGACGVATARPSLSRARSPAGCRRPGPSLQRDSDTEDDTDGDSGDSGRGGAVGLGRRSSPPADVVPRLAPARVSPTSPPWLTRRRPVARDPAGGVPRETAPFAALLPPRGAHTVLLRRHRSDRVRSDASRSATTAPRRPTVLSPPDLSPPAAASS